MAKRSNITKDEMYSKLEFRKGDETTEQQLREGETPKPKRAPKTTWISSPEQKLDKKVSERVDPVQQAAIKLKEGKLTNEQYKAVVEEYSRPEVITEFIEPAPKDRIERSFDISIKALLTLLWPSRPCSISSR